MILCTFYFYLPVVALSHVTVCLCLCVCDNPSKKWVLFLGSHRATFLSLFFVKAAHFISKLWQTLDCFATHTKTHMQGGNTFSFVMSRGVGQHCCSNSLLLILWFPKSHVIAWSHRPSSEGINCATLPSLPPQHHRASWYNTGKITWNAGIRRSR